MKTWTASSIAAFALVGTAMTASAAEPAMPDQHMMQAQAQGGSASGGMPGYGMGMMGGGMGPGYGMGPGMGMMGGGCPMGMMGGGMGPGMGMMGGGMGGFGPGAGMMMGPGMMGGMGAGYGMGPMAMLDLSDAQTAQLKKIQTESKQKLRTLMRQMWEEQDKLSDLYDAEKRDPATIGKAYGKLADLQRQALEARIDMENKMAAVLTTEQKAQMRRGFGRGMMGN
jgi:Spy/CpxP family protein refolding chaperone